MSPAQGNALGPERDRAEKALKGRGKSSLRTFPRPFRASTLDSSTIPRALPWAGIPWPFRPVSSTHLYLTLLPVLLPPGAEALFQPLHVGVGLDLRHPDISSARSSFADHALGDTILSSANVLREFPG